jgi:ABC-type transporter lipoprotein component MlaA
MHDETVWAMMVNKEQAWKLKKSSHFGHYNRFFKNSFLGLFGL